MKALLDKLHSRLGDFWWYSLMLFCAMRTADCLNVFVGLWLVPKYVEPSELGAVMPLTQFANFLAIPIAVFASTFRNELTSLAVNRRFGQMKTLMRSVFIATGIFLVLALVVCRFVLPAYLERIRIAEGSLGVIILLSAFVGAVSPIYSNALQALKKLKTNSLINLLGAPIRLLAMLITMPFRALSGYFIGQASTPLFNIFAVIIGLRKELSIPAEPYWTRDIIRRFTHLFLIFGISAIAGGICMLVESTILRQRLPELDSAAYYMVTRFSDIATFLSSALSFTLFPFTAELAAKGKDTRPLIVKAALAVIVTNAILLGAYWCFGEPLLSVLPHGDKYAAFWWAMPWMVANTTIGMTCGLYTTSEISAFRFGYLKWWIPLDLLYPALLLFVTGHGYFDAHLPSSWVHFLTTHNISSLSTMLWWMTGANIIRLGGCVIALFGKGHD